jgi:hypothetical protein
LTAHIRVGVATGPPAQAQADNNHGADRFRRWDRKSNVRPELLRLVKRGNQNKRQA